MHKPSQIRHTTHLDIDTVSMTNSLKKDIEIRDNIWEQMPLMTDCTSCSDSCEEGEGDDQINHIDDPSKMGLVYY